LDEGDLVNQVDGKKMREQKHISKYNGNKSTEIFKTKPLLFIIIIKKYIILFTIHYKSFWYITMTYFTFYIFIVY
jgi:hypothetical protein